MSNQTVQYKRTVKGSVGAGMSAIFNGNGRQFYILEHKDSSKYHHAGESQKIIIDQIELGRDKSCQVRFDDATWPTVSRKHAAIERDNNGWKIIPLSQTNSTLVNGKPIKTEWFLQNGDEIQLSKDGPKIGFIAPQGKQSLVSSIKLTERLNLFREQALRPYKTALTVLSVLFVVCIGALAYWNVIEHNKVKAAYAQIDNLKHANDTLKESIAINQRLSDSINAVNNAKSVSHAGQIANLSSHLGKMVSVLGMADENAMKKVKESVYYIQVAKIDVTFADGSKTTINYGDEGSSGLFWSGTGFLLDDGRFVTARHVIDGLKFISSKKELKKLFLNDVANTGGDVTITFVAVSPTDSFSFTNHDLRMNHSTDETGTIEVELGGVPMELTVTIAEAGATDWAVMNTSKKGSIHANANLSKNLKQQTNLVVVGYPSGYHTDNVGSLNGSCTVASDGLYKGLITITARNFEHGNSGGPAFYVNSNGNLEAVGLISAGYGDTVGFIVPLANVN